MKYSSLQIAALVKNATADNATEGEGEEEEEEDKGENISTTNQSGNITEITPTDSSVKNKMVKLLTWNTHSFIATCN